jgi:hypothetical protein
MICSDVRIQHLDHIRSDIRASADADVATRFPKIVPTRNGKLDDAKEEVRLVLSGSNISLHRRECRPVSATLYPAL